VSRAPRKTPQTVDWAAVQYQPAEGTMLLRCSRCGGAWLDDEPGRQAHIAVFGHSPRLLEPARPPAESTGGETTS
jgi:hypothetical protein